MRRGMRRMVRCMIVLSLSLGCASGAKTVKSEQTVQYPAKATQATTEPVAVEKKTTTHTETQGHPQGVLSTLVHVVGEIIALPFRLLGGLIRLIF